MPKKPDLVGSVPFAEAFAVAKRRFIKRYLEELLEATQQNVSRAAAFAKLDRSNFKRLMRAAGVERKERAWNGLCRANQHGLDYAGQPCELCSPSESKGPARIQLPPGVGIADVVIRGVAPGPADAFLNTECVIDDDA